MTASIGDNGGDASAGGSPRECAVPVQVKIEARAHTYAVGDTNGHSDTQRRPLSEGLLAGHNEGILQKRSRDGSHRQDRRREKEHFFLPSPLLLLPTSSLATLDFVTCDLQHINWPQ